MFADKKKKKKDINIFVFSIFAIICFKSFSINAIKLPQDEVDALQQIATTLGSKYWKFDAESCTVEKVGLTETPPPLAEQVIECECSPTNETDCHVVKIALKDHSLPGTLPPQIGKLPKLREIDFAYNYLNGTIPLEWFTTNLTLMSKVLPCIDDFKCPRCKYTHLLKGLVMIDLFTIASHLKVHTIDIVTYCLIIIVDSSCLHVNCGGSDLTLTQNKTKILYQGDGEAEGGAAKYYLKHNAYWGFSSTGDYMDDNNFQNTRFTVFVPTSNLSDLYKTARIAPVSLTYFHACLENGKYTVNLDFAEMRFTNDETYNRLGRRVFDIYIQEKLVVKDFNIMEEAKGAQKPITKSFTVNVTNHFLAIRLSWAGKGTTRIPTRGVYGPLISAISIVSDPNEEELPSGTFTLRQIKFATDDFNPANKIGEGGFGPVFKGVLSDGRVVAVKQLSSKSRQGNREFLNEIGAISCLQHPNLVKLHGFCVERSQLLLVYEYMENNSLAQALFSPKHKQIPLDWPTRFKICCGIAKGLAFLHEESPLKFVHRDIKATNILLDKDLTPKISDFGLARLDEEENTHVSTKVAGTIGYMAPEYALWGYLSFKADVYSYGVLVLEIVAGINNSSFMAAGDEVCLLEWAMECEESGDLMQVVDERLRPEVDKKEAETLIKVALVCTSASASDRPIMSEVVGMLEGHYPVPEPTPGTSRKSGDIRFKAFKDVRKGMEENSSKTQFSLNSYPSSSSDTHVAGQERKQDE
uniref:non-specific serine/threonine protein kinase n=1 Tax=Brassica campestris TaxID=3711 RepID=M4D2W2_BRACM